MEGAGPYKFDITDKDNLEKMKNFTFMTKESDTATIVTHFEVAQGNLNVTRNLINDLIDGSPDVLRRYLEIKDEKASLEQARISILSQLEAETS